MTGFSLLMLLLFVAGLIALNLYLRWRWWRCRATDRTRNAPAAGLADTARSPQE